MSGLASRALYTTDPWSQMFHTNCKTGFCNGNFALHSERYLRLLGAMEPASWYQHTYCAFCRTEKAQTLAIMMPELSFVQSQRYSIIYLWKNILSCTMALEISTIFDKSSTFLLQRKCVRDFWDPLYVQHTYSHDCGKEILDAL